MKVCTKVALYSCLVNGFLTTAKYFLGEVSASMAFKADAIHSLADVVSSLSILAGILISERRTKTFPQGLYKVENLVALLSSTFILFAAFEIVYSTMQAGHQEPIRHVGPVTAGAVFMLVVTCLFSRYELKAGVKAGSPSLIADAKHIGTDVLSSSLIIVSILGSRLGIALDRYAAVIIAALVARIGLTILVDSIKVLLDATLDGSILNGIREVLSEHPLVTQIGSVGGRSSGRYKFVEVDIKLNVRLLRDAHSEVSLMEEEILDRWPDIDRILIHYEPERQEFIRIAAPLDIPEGTQPSPDSLLSEHFGDASCFAVLKKEILTGNVIIEGFLENAFAALDRRRGVKAAELLADAEVDEVRARAALDGKGAGYALEALGVDVLTTNAATLRELVSEVAAPERAKIATVEQQVPSGQTAAGGQHADSK